MIVIASGLLSPGRRGSEKVLTLPMAGASDMARVELWYLPQLGGWESAVPHAPKATRSSIHD
jgi:hypothetical protein